MCHGREGTENGHVAHYAVGEYAVPRARELKMARSCTYCPGQCTKQVGETLPNKRVLAVSSGGGHWVQLLRLLPAFEGQDVAFVTVSGAYRPEVGHRRFYVVNDATRWNKLGLLLLAFRLLRIICRERPSVIISTGAAPGYLALRIGRWYGAHTIWIDSIANVESLSLSGQRIGRHVDLWLTQWPHLARPEGPHFSGSVL